MVNRVPDSEQRILSRLKSYLADQGWLDPDDQRLLARFLSNHTGFLREDGWSEIEAQLLEQESDELANELGERRVPDPETILANVAESVSRITPLDTEWAVFVGAGGSKPQPTNIPLVTELLPTLWQKATEVNAKHLLELRERCEALGIGNIEELLTAIDITRSAVATPRVRGLIENLLIGPQTRPELRGRLRGAQISRDPGLAERLQESMQTLFSLLVGMMRSAPPNAFHDSLAERSTGASRLSIIMTNYDICVERALGKDGYRYAGIHSEPADLTTLLKLHGSLNWFACGSCDEVVAASLDDVETLIRARLYPVVSQCPYCDATAPHLIVPPVGIKLAEHPVLLQIRQLAEDRLRDAPIVAFVGYSFSEADEYVLKMVSRAVTGSETQVLVFDEGEEAVQRLRAFLIAHARDYDVAAHVTQVSGDAAVTFPLFVKAWRREVAEAANVEPAPTDGAHA